MKLILVRHGESEGNKLLTIQGHKDYTLTAEGIEQARLLANRLKGQTFDLVLCSDLIRAKQTLDEIKPNITCSKVIYDSRLRERNFGKYEGQVHNKQNIITEDFHSNLSGTGESTSEHQARVTQAILSQITPEIQSMLVVCHGGSIKVFLAALTNTELEKAYSCFKTDNTCVYELNITNETFEIITENCTKHLS
jgi:broad specificity phosphatase PhoE